jgi:hypothetical protein
MTFESFFRKKLSSDKFFSPKSLPKFVSIISWAGHKYNKNLRVLPKKKLPSGKHLFIFGRNSLPNKFSV